MDSETLEKYRKAGTIARAALEKGKEMCNVGVKYLDVAEAIEEEIENRGARSAFPTNVSVNSIGAHYTPVIDDDKELEKGDLVKLDTGCHVDGHIADNALTVEIGTNRQKALIKASEEALEFAIKSIRPGMKTRDVGKNIETVIESRGFKPISNLTGHQLKQYELHAGLTVPNVPKGWKKIKEGMVLAIEPFATDGVGEVEGNRKSEIYKLEEPRRLKDEDLEFYQWLKDEFDHLPFTSRWCSDYGEDHKELLERLHRFGSVMNYPILEERKKGMVSQREHTVIVTSSGCEVTTTL